MDAQFVAYASIAAVVILFCIRVLKSGQVDATLMHFGLPSIPDKAIPFIALGLGVIGGLTDALVQGMGWKEALQTVVLGLFSGSGAVAMHETVVKNWPSAPLPPAA